MKKAVDIMSNTGITLNYNVLLSNYNKHCAYLESLITYLYDNYVLVDTRYSQAEIMRYLYEVAPNYIRNLVNVTGSVNLSLANLKKCKIDMIDLNHAEKDTIKACFNALYEYQVLVELTKFYRQSAFSNKHKPTKINYKFQYILNEGLRNKFGKSYSAPLDIFIESLDTGIYVFVDNLDITIRGIGQKYNLEIPEGRKFFSNIEDIELAESIFNLSIKGETEFAKNLYDILYKDFIDVNKISEGRWHYSTEYELLYATLIPEFNAKQSKFREEHPEAEIKYISSIGVLYKVSSKIPEYKNYVLVNRQSSYRGINYLDNSELDLQYEGQFITEDAMPIDEDFIYYKSGKTICFNKNTPILDSIDKGFILTDLI